MRYVIIDIEASGFDGFPIEVGWCDQDGVAEGHLIRPAWNWCGWDLRAERLHGISREYLTIHGEPHEAVAKQVACRLSRWREDQVIVASDNPGFDQDWLVMLLRRANIDEQVRLLDVTEIYAAAVRPLFAGEPLEDDTAFGVGFEWATARAAAIVANAKARVSPERRHRAVDDARRLREIVEVIRAEVADTLT